MNTFRLIGLAFAFLMLTSCKTPLPENRETIFLDDFSSEEYIWENWTPNTNNFHIISIEL